MESDISDNDYAHTLKIWEYSNIQVWGEFSDFYLLTDHFLLIILILTNIFENFIDLCLDTLNLDTVYFMTALGLTFEY